MAVLSFLRGYETDDREETYLQLIRRIDIEPIQSRIKTEMEKIFAEKLQNY